jgi:hypothetical protein
MSNALHPSHTNLSAKRDDRGTPFQVLQQNFSHHHHQDYTTTDPRHHNAGSNQHSKDDHDLSIRWHPPHYRTKMWDNESWSHHQDAPASLRPAYPTQEPPLLPKTLCTAQNCITTPSPTFSKRTMLQEDTDNCTPSPPKKARTTVHDCNVVSPGAKLIWELHPSDIVCGRGAPTNYHQGNEEFRYIVEDYQTSYLCAKRSDKPGVAFKLLEVVKSRGGRFLKRKKASGRQAWAEVGEKQAYEKVCQALRDGAPKLRRQMMASSKKKEVRESNWEGENCSNIQNWR